jgi:PPM family protein phosphatase
MAVSYGARTDTGLVRTVNEDLFVAEPELGLFAVVDGLGGHAAGQAAAQTVAATITAFIRDTAGKSDNTWPFGIDPQLSELANRLQVAIRLANRQLAARAHNDAALSGSGATIATALFGGGRLVASNVGDCRAYLLRDGLLVQLTRDHSYVAQEVAMGRLDADAARTHPMRHVVTRAVAGDPNMIVDVGEFDTRAGDRLLLCSDGIHGAVPDGELLEFVTGRDPLNDICAALIDRANARGGHDNATVIIVDVQEGAA